MEIVQHILVAHAINLTQKYQKNKKNRSYLFSDYLSFSALRLMIEAKLSA